MAPCSAGLGGQHAYARVWELHPLVVVPAAQRRGIGRALVADLEAQVRERGGLTILLGSDDETDMTTLSRVEVYPDVWTHIANIRAFRQHLATRSLPAISADSADRRHA